MFILNKASKEVKLASFEGYTFTVPVGVSAIWDKAGEQLLKTHKVESKGGIETHHTSSGPVIFDQGHGVPALYAAQQRDWVLGGRQLARVERYKIRHNLIPRNQLIKIALQRGISRDRVTEYQVDSTIDSEVIADEINALPVPESVKHPHSIEEDTVEPEVEEEGVKAPAFSQGS